MHPIKRSRWRLRQALSAAMLAGILLGLAGFSLVARAAAGSLDTTFNTTGKVTTAIESSDDLAGSVAIQSDGKIVAAGYSSNGARRFFSLTRHNANGSLDTTFNGAGKLTTAIGSIDDGARSVAIQSDGKIVAAGFSDNGTQYVFGLSRYNADGSLDITFNSSGKVTTAIGLNDQANSVAIQPDGKIVAAGLSNNGAQYVFALARYNPDGSVDATFNGAGKLTTAIGSIDDVAVSVAIQPDGKIVAAGFSNNGTQYVFALTRYNADGSLDTTFNGTGKVTTAIGSGVDAANSVVIQPDGKIVAAGSSNNGAQDVFALARYNANGSLDSAFNSTGKVTTAIGSISDLGYSVALQPDGKIVAAGDSWTGTHRVFALARYNANGSLDSTFNTTGKLTIAFGSGDDDARSIAIQRDGKIVAAGFSMTSTKFVFALARYVGDQPHGVIYNGNGSTGGTVPADSNAYAVGVTVTVLGNTGSLVKAGYTFAGWNTAANGSGTNYAGGATFAMGSGNVTLYAKWATSSATTLGAPANPSVFGQSVTFTATVTGNAPSGLVRFNDGGSVLCAAAPLSGGQASCTVDALGVGTHDVSAVYAGDSNNTGSTSAVLTQTVNKATTTTAIVIHTPNPSVAGSPIAVTVGLAVTAPGAGTPTGTITVSDGSAICGIALPTTSCNLTPSSAGAKTLTAAYGGDAHFSGSNSAGVGHTVNPANGTTTLSSSANPSMVGKAVTLTASVFGASPSGTVNFRDGNGSIGGCAAQLVVSGQASCITSGLTLGSHNITAVYSGDAINPGGISGTLVQRVIGRAALGIPAWLMLLLD